MNATPWATTWFPTTSPTSRRADSTAGPGSTWAAPHGGLQDPRHPGKHPELQSKVITPDILVNPHFASLEMLFYEGSQFPAEYKGDGFAAEHGSWNRAQRAGYEVIRLPMKNGHATGEYEDFLTGFVNPDGTVWGRPVGVARGQRRLPVRLRRRLQIHLARDLYRQVNSLGLLTSK